MKKTIIYFIAIITIGIGFPMETKGQDFILSQPYNNSIVIAPSFAGLTNGGRVALSYRNQWPGLSNFNTYVTYIAAFDYFLQEFNSGIGALVSNDIQAGGLVRSTEGALQYNYRVQLGGRHGSVYFRPGVQVKFMHKSLDFSRFIFSENIMVDGSIVNNGIHFDVEVESYNKLDAAFSSLFYNRHFWAGFNIDHLIPSNVSFLNQDAKIPIKFSIMGGYNLIYKESGWRNPYDEAVTFSVLLQRQGQFSQMDLGVAWTKSIFQVGAAYRGFLPVSTLTAHDAFIFSLGLNMEQFKVVYSYDVSLSALHNVSAGSHEISLQFFFNQKERSPMSFFCR